MNPIYNEYDYDFIIWDLIEIKYKKYYLFIFPFKSGITSKILICRSRMLGNVPYDKHLLTL